MFNTMHMHSHSCMNVLLLTRMVGYIERCMVAYRAVTPPAHLLSATHSVAACACSKQQPLIAMLTLLISFIESRQKALCAGCSM